MHSAADLDWVAAELNDRPRKRLADRTPIEHTASGQRIEAAVCSMNAVAGRGSMPASRRGVSSHSPGCVSKKSDGPIPEASSGVRIPHHPISFGPAAGLSAIRRVAGS